MVLVKLVSSLVLLAACGGNPAPAARVENVVGLHAPVDAYAGLFAEDGSWEFSVTYATEYRDPEDSDADPGGMVHTEDTFSASCHGGIPYEVDGVAARKVQCDGFVGIDVPPPMFGIWIADAAGLWYVGDTWAPNEDEPLLRDHQQLVFPARPVTTSQVRPDGDGWCWSHSWTSSYDNGTATVCLAESGFTHGAVIWWMDDVEHEMTFEVTSRS